MKKTISVILACLLLLSLLPVLAAADGGELPFELVAPGNVTAEYLNGDDSPTTTRIVYSLSNEMTAFFLAKEEAAADGRIEAFMADYGYDDISITTQVDWAVDDVNDSVCGWHANEFWKADYGFGYDEEYRIRVGEWDGVDLWVGNWTETLNEHSITRCVTEDAFNGNPDTMTPGLKDQLLPSQYTYTYQDGEGSLHIDYTQHTVYFRMRFVVTTSKDTDDGTQDTYYYSDWSETTCVGKDAEVFAPLTKADLPAPEITSLRMTDKTFNDNPIVAFTLSVPDELAANAARVAAAGGVIWIETWCRVKGDTEWTQMANAEHNIKAGEMECPLLHLVNDERPTIPQDTEIELRCRYYCAQEGQDEFWSDYSEILTFGTDDIQQGGAPGGDVTVPDETVPEEPQSVAKKTCSLCHFCPQPLGLCIFIWLLILIVLVAVIIIIVKKAGKKQKSSKK